MLKKYFTYLFRHGNAYKKYLHEITLSEKYSSTELCEYQNEKLRNIMKTAYENVPYYHESFKKAKLHFSDIKGTEDLPKLPLINKKTVRDNFKDFKNRNFRGFVAKGITSGTTGTPGIFLRDMRSIRYETAFITRQLEWAGIENRNKRASLRGDHLFKNEKNSPPYWKTDPIENKLWLSSYHLSDTTLPYYIDMLKEFKPPLLQAYPSTAYIVAKYLEKTNSYLDIPIVQTSSETLFSTWRELIEQRLNCRIFDFYGQSERVVFGAECEYHQGLHIPPSYSCFELVDRDGNSSSTRGRIVGTTLNNLVMPLIRYQTDDLAEMLPAKCACGKNFPQIKPLETRDTNTLMTRGGRIISTTLFAVFFRKLKGIKLSQIIQKNDFSFQVKVVKDDNYSSPTSEEIIKNIHDLMENDVPVDIIFVEDIPRTKNGKFQWVISEKNL